MEDHLNKFLGHTWRGINTHILSYTRETPKQVCLMFHGINSTGSINTSLNQGTAIISEVLSRKSNGVTITFDDAYENIESALELWSGFDIPLKIFVPTDLIGKKMANMRIADIPQLKYWKSIKNVTLASHSHSHTNLTRLTQQSRLNELTASKHKIEELTNVSCQEIAYPRGKYNLQVLEDVKKAGFLTGWTTKRGAFDLGQADLLTLPRFAIYDYTTPREMTGRISRAAIKIERLILRGNYR
jgi:peptidoglycan/xylan/chitin deacetylase (PgdA/CDA1 family)